MEHVNDCSHPKARVWVALGSNLGDAVSQIRKAWLELERLSVAPLCRSSLWLSEPVDCPSGAPPFVNAVAGLVPAPEETPESFLSRLLELETRLGRAPRRERNEPRVIDLDLIAFGSERRRTTTLSLPHARAHKRRFVLAPLAEVAPELILPGQSASVRDLLQSLPPRPAAWRMD